MQSSEEVQKVSKVKDEEEEEDRKEGDRKDGVKKVGKRRRRKIESWWRKLGRRKMKRKMGRRMRSTGRISTGRRREEKMVLSMSVTLANMNKQLIMFFLFVCLSRTVDLQQIPQHHLHSLKRPCSNKTRILKRPRRTITPYTKAMRDVVFNGRELDDT